VRRSEEQQQHTAPIAITNNRSPVSSLISGLDVMSSFNLDFAEVVLVNTVPGFDFPRPASEKVNFVGPIISEMEAIVPDIKVGSKRMGDVDIEALMDGHGEKGGKVGHT